MNRIAIAGAGLAGLSSARALRALGYAGTICLIGEELHQPYDRPPLSKEFLAGRQQAVDIALAAPRDDELDLDWRLGVRAAGLKVSGPPGEPDSFAVEIDSGEPVPADGVVIATGGRARDLPGEWHGNALLTGVHTLRTLDDAHQLRAELSSGARLVVAGGGFIGAEIASTATELDVNVTLVEAAAVPLLVPLGDWLAGELAKVHAAHGVTLITGVGVAALEGDDRVTGVRLADGRVLPADVVVVGIGSVPNVEWLTGSGVELADPRQGGGVLVDEHGRSSLPGVVATGDVAAGFDPLAGRVVRGEHWTSALQHPNLAAAALLGVEPRPQPAHATVPYFWSDQYGERLQFAGYRRDGDDVEIVDGALEPGPDGARRFVAVYRRDGLPVAVLGVGVPRTFNRIRRELVATGAQLSPTSAPSAQAART